MSFPSRSRWLPTAVAVGVLAGGPAATAATPAGPSALDALKQSGLVAGKVAFRLPNRALPLEATLAFGSRASGHDASGAYQADRFRLAFSPRDGQAARDVHATIVLKRYAASHVVVAALDYSGPALAAHDGFHMHLDLPGYAKGMAIHRYRPYWTVPVFAANPQQLPDQNVLMLWQAANRAGYRLLVPLAGDGMVGQVGDHDFDFGLTLSSNMAHAPHHVPLFAFAPGADPYRLARSAYGAAFSGEKFYGRLAWQKGYPEVYRSLGWCSWNAFYDKVRREDIVAAARSLQARHVPVGYMLLDDGWLDLNGRRLAGYDTNAKFPGGLKSLVEELKTTYHVPHVGVWHALTGGWDGVDPQSAIGRGHPLLRGGEGLSVADPRGAAGASFFEDWYHHLQAAGIDFVKVDNQAGLPRFTDDHVPLFEAATNAQRAIQTAAMRHFPSREGAGLVAPALTNCMDLTLENVYNWHSSNVARSSNDYEPEDPTTSQRHVYENIYNAYWLGNFARPDFDMFQSFRPDAEFHAIARAMSGGPVYTTDLPGKENVTLLRRLARADGRLYAADAPALPSRDCLLVDTAMQPRPLKLQATITHRGLAWGLLAAFNVNRSARQEQGSVALTDIEGLRPVAGKGNFAVYDRNRGAIAGLWGQLQRTTPFTLGASNVNLLTAAPVLKGGVAIFGLLDKYLSPAAIVGLAPLPNGWRVRLAEAGEFGAYCVHRPLGVVVDGRTLAASELHYSRGLLRVSPAAFKAGARTHELRLTL